MRYTLNKSGTINIRTLKGLDRFTYFDLRWQYNMQTKPKGKSKKRIEYDEWISSFWVDLDKKNADSFAEKST